MSISCLWFIEKAASLPSEPVVADVVNAINWSHAFPTQNVESAGRAYWSFACRSKVIDKQKIESITVFGSESEKDVGSKDDGDAVIFKLRDDLNADNIGNFTYYELLGFDKYGSGVTDDGLKKAYRKAVLKYHPDKMGAGAAEEGEEDEVFISMQKAYETLTNVEKRRAYDSSLEFDDTIPEDGAGNNGDFFEIFRSVFERNERFAVMVPAPPLGNEDDSIEDVNKFYEYWSNFESWRDFTIEASEHNLDDAEDRIHKRWMEKENAKKIKDLKRKEYKRISKLVENARAVDPRIRRARIAEAEAKKARQEAKIAEKREREEAIVRRALEEKMRAEAEAEASKIAARDAKANRERLKQESRRLKKLLRTAFDMATELEKESGVQCDDIAQSHLEFFMEYASVELLSEAAETLKEDGSGGRSSLRDLFDRIKSEQSAAFAALEKVREAEKARNEAILKRQEQQVQKNARNIKTTTPWSEEELSALAKAVGKFPAGIQSRWTKVAEYVATSANSNKIRNKEECIAKYQEIAAMPIKPVATAAPMSPEVTSEIELNNGFGTISISSEEKPVAQNGSSNGIMHAPLEPKDTGGNVSTSVKVPEDVWTDEQHRAFLAALAKYSDSMEKNERWNAIANAVEGKSRAQCVNRFKFVKSRILAKKQVVTSSERK